MVLVQDREVGCAREGSSGSYGVAKAISSKLEGVYPDICARRITLWVDSSGIAPYMHSRRYTTTTFVFGKLLLPARKSPVLRPSF